jgi:hypothetical protein
MGVFLLLQRALGEVYFPKKRLSLLWDRFEDASETFNEMNDILHNAD